MAQKQYTVLEDDIDGGEATETVSFGYKGKSYIIDLNAKNAAAFEKAVDKFVKAARHEAVSTRARAARGSGARRSGAKADVNAVRVWAAANGHAISTRGRIPGGIMAAYKAANG